MKFLAAVGVILVLLSHGCSYRYIECRTRLVDDETGGPIVGAHVTAWYPVKSPVVVPRSSEGITDERGEVLLQVARREGHYWPWWRIEADGYIGPEWEGAEAAREAIAVALRERQDQVEVVLRVRRR